MKCFLGKAAVLTLATVLSACVRHYGNPNTPYPFGWSPRLTLSSDCRELAGRYKYLAVQVAPASEGTYKQAVDIFSVPGEMQEQGWRFRHPHLMSFEIYIGSEDRTQLRIRYFDHAGDLIGEHVIPRQGALGKIQTSQRFECRDGSLQVHQSSKGPRGDMQFWRTLTRSAHDDLIVEMVDVGGFHSGEGGRQSVNNHYWVRFR